MPEDDLPPPALPWAAITVGTLGVLALYVVFVRTTTGQVWDSAAMDRAAAATTLAPLAHQLVHHLSPERMVVLCAMACLTGLLRGWRTAVGAGVACAVCLGVPQLLKAALPRPQLADPWPMSNSLPSGHTAAVAALTVALVLVLPAAWRGVVLLGGLLATAATATAVVVLTYHRPSDVVASWALAMVAWGAGVLVAGRRPTRSPAGQATRSSTAASP